MMVLLLFKSAVDANFTFANSFRYRKAFSCLSSGLKVVSSVLSFDAGYHIHLTENVTFYKTVYNRQTNLNLELHRVNVKNKYF